MIVSEEIFPLLHKLNKYQKLQTLQFLMVELLHAEAAEESFNMPEQIGWPPNYFSETFGMLQDDPLARPEQGSFEIREPFV